MPDNKQILASLGEVVKEATAGEVSEELTEDMSFAEDLDVDSLSMVEIAVLTEEKFGVKISDDELPKFITVRDLANYVAAHSSQEP